MAGGVVQFVFAVTFVMALGCSIAMLFAPNAVHVALFLVGAQIALAVAFLLEGAQFDAIMQIIVYAGAIMVLFLFVIMLLGVDRREALVEPLRFQRSLAAGLGLLLAAALVYVGYRSVNLVVGGAGSGAIEAINRSPGNTQGIARVLFGTYELPFEATSVLLVVAIVGVMVLARRISGAQAREAARAEQEAAGREEEAA